MTESSILIFEMEKRAGAIMTSELRILFSERGRVVKEMRERLQPLGYWIVKEPHLTIKGQNMYVLMNMNENKRVSKFPSFVKKEQAFSEPESIVSAPSPSLRQSVEAREKELFPTERLPDGTVREIG